jgi:hypothetical protein
MDCQQTDSVLNAIGDSLLACEHHEHVFLEGHSTSMQERLSVDPPCLSATMIHETDIFWSLLVHFLSMLVS